MRELESLWVCSYPGSVISSGRPMPQQRQHIDICEEESGLIPSIDPAYDEELQQLRDGKRCDLGPCRWPVLDLLPLTSQVHQTDHITVSIPFSPSQCGTICSVKDSGVLR